jgi:beta-N-acetylhexosaminidase
MAERLPPDEGDDLFEWTDAPERPRPPREPDTGERELAGAGARERPRTGERERLEQSEAGPPPPTGEADPLATGERRAVRERLFGRGRRSDTEERRRIRGETGEFERSGRRPPPGRRARRRDLPARVRRRQDAAVAVVGVALVVGLIALVSGGGGNGGGEETFPLKRLVGQTIVAQLGKGAPETGLVKRVRKGQVGGVIVESTNPESVRAGVSSLQQAASAGDNPPLLVMIDQEGGGVKRLKDGPPDSSPQQLGAAGDADAAKEEGEKTASFLAGLGINVDLAPVLDVPQPSADRSIANRAFGDDPALVASVGVQFAEGLQDGGVFATAKHFPGLGRATRSTDEGPVNVVALEEDLQADLQPFSEAIDAGISMVMVSSASYSTLGSKKQAAFSPAIVKGLLRDELGFDGVVITDDLDAPAVSNVTTPGLAAANALKAGDDLLLFAGSGDSATRAFGSLIAQVKRGTLDRGPIEDAYDRITSLKESLSG